MNGMFQKVGTFVATHKEPIIKKGLIALGTIAGLVLVGVVLRGQEVITNEDGLAEVPPAEPKDEYPAAE